MYRLSSDCFTFLSLKFWSLEYIWQHPPYFPYIRKVRRHEIRDDLEAQYFQKNHFLSKLLVLNNQEERLTALVRSQKYKI